MRAPWRDQLENACPETKTCRPEKAARAVILLAPPTLSTQDRTISATLPAGWAGITRAARKPFRHQPVEREGPSKAIGAVLHKSHNKRICLLSVENVWTR
jgi:hypothetical protein